MIEPVVIPDDEVMTRIRETRRRIFRSCNDDIESYIRRLMDLESREEGMSEERTNSTQL